MLLSLKAGLFVVSETRRSEGCEAWPREGDFCWKDPRVHTSVATLHRNGTSWQSLGAVKEQSR